MPSQEEFDNFEPFPVSPRSSLDSVQSYGNPAPQTDQDPKTQSKRQFTPVDHSNVEYRTQRAKESMTPAEKNYRRTPHAKRADQFGMLLMVCCLLVLLIVLGAIWMNNKRYTFATGQSVETNAVEVDFYQGNHVFSEKFAEEKAAKEASQGHPVHGITTVNDNLEIPLTDQMDSMDQKLAKMRAAKAADEVAPPTPDSGYKPDAVQVKPTKTEDFQTPKDLNLAIPKGLPTNSSSAAAGT